MDIAFISCVKKKKIGEYKAIELYISDYFKKSLKYCSMNYNKIFILSAKYGLLNLDSKIKDYELTLNSLSKEEKIIWANKVAIQIKKSVNKEDILHFYVGNNYRQHLIPLLDNDYNIPLIGLGIGKQLKFFKDNTKSDILLFNFNP
tara:strand:- start:38 stop:475 length:438 start_codon:yes stop_codon:yes gene_type:complete